MRPVRSRSQGVPLKSVVLLGIVLVPIAVVGAVGTLWELGQIDLPFLRKGEQIPPGSMAVVVSAPLPNGKPIPAYTKLIREHVWDVRKDRLSCVYLTPDKITKEMIIDLNQILGRVLKHDKPPGYVFTEQDFLPKNTLPGLTGGIPIGRKLITLDASKVEGFFGLQLGDHVDLVATFQIEMPKGGGGMYSSLFQTEAQMATMQKRARVRPLAQDAVLVTAEHIREKPTISKSLSQGTKVKMIPIQEVDLAVKPEEVSLINEALATDVKITAVARSGQPGDDSDTETPGSDPLSEFPVVEGIVGNKRGVVVFRPPNDLGPGNKSRKAPHSKPPATSRHRQPRVALSDLPNDQSLAPATQH
jgi:hypothetical protein